MGIQSASSNQFDQNSGLKDAATKDFATATYDSPKTPGGTDRYAQNEGVLFP
ncbi:MAG: hypothetical protein MJ219_03715 [Mycoplasmoidaceae bacterium]|nr:hypothetical protein [Mycoplasmoidaceae bacterium]